MHLFCREYQLFTIIALIKAMKVTSGWTLVAVVEVVCFLLLSCLGGSLSEIKSAEHQTRIFDACMTHLKTRPVNAGLSRKEFIALVGVLNHDDIAGSSVPLSYSAAFNMNACLNGKNCVGKHAMISVSSSDERSRVCSSIVPLVSDECLLKGNKVSAGAGGENETAAACASVDEFAAIG